MPLPAGTLRIIAEPGRYFAEAFATYACFINGWRGRSEGEAAEQHYDYFISDGLYGSMNWCAGQVPLGWRAGRCRKACRCAARAAKDAAPIACCILHHPSLGQTT